MTSARRAQWTAAVVALVWLGGAPAAACGPAALAKPALAPVLHVRPGSGRLPPASPPVAQPAQAPVKTALAGRRDDDHGRGGAAAARFAPATARGAACRGPRRAVAASDDHGTADAASFHDAHAPPSRALPIAGRRA